MIQVYNQEKSAEKFDAKKEETALSNMAARYAGQCIYELRDKEVFGQNRLTIISQRFHNERAIYLAEKNGIDAIGYNAQNVNAYAGLKTNIRELLARVKMFIDLGMDKQPHFLGEKIIIGNNK